MGDNVEVSVMCLAYNHEKYIRQTLEGFIEQRTNFQFEVIVHDDASTDETRHIIEEYASLYPDIIKPIYQSRNQYSKIDAEIFSKFMYPQARGKYFAYCEGDDYWSDKYKLQKQFDILENHPECSICVHKVQCINEDGTENVRVIPESKYGISRGGYQSDYDIADCLWQNGGGYPFHTSSYFIRRSALYDCMNGTMPCIGFMNGDHIILRCALKAGSFWYIDEAMSYRRLWSIGNYNSRFLLIADSEKMRITLKMAEGNMLYDDYTYGRFHEWIKRYMSDILITTGIVDKKLMMCEINRMGLAYDECKKLYRRKYYFKRIALIKYPKIYKLLKNADRFIHHE